MSGTKKIVFSILAIVLAGVFVFGVGEALIRLKNLSMTNYDVEMWRYARELKRRSDDTILGHDHVPSSMAVLQSVEIRTNEYGLRGGPVGPMAPDGRRILFIGSSITLGWGVPEDKTMTSLLQEKFAADGQTDVQVLNGGIGNYNTKRYVERYLTKLYKLEPTDIVVHYFVNDAEELESGGGNFLLEHSQLALTLWIAFNRFIYSSDDTDLIAHYKNIYEPDQKGYKNMKASLQKLVDRARTDHTRLLLAMVPDVHNLTNYQFIFIHERMRQICAEMGIPFVDLLPAFEDRDPTTLWAMPGDPHPNALGHQLMADELYQPLKAMVP